MSDLLKQFDTIVLDMNNTFVFGGDRFSLTEDYFHTYKMLGGSQLTQSQVSRIVNNVFNTLEPLYLDDTRHEDFPTVAGTIQRLPDSRDLSPEEKSRLVNVFLEHELGKIPSEYVNAIERLSQTHTLHLISNIWSPSGRFLELLKDAGVEKCFATIVFSSDFRTVKPSPKLLSSQLIFGEQDRYVVVGDCQRCDMGLAKNAGMKSVWLSYGRKLDKDQPLPDFVANDLLVLVPDYERSSNFSSISSKTIRLRPTGPTDLDYVLNAESDSDNSPFIVNWTYDEHLASLSKSDILHLVVETIEEPRAVGFVVLRGFDLSQGPVELKRIVITEKLTGFGLATLTLLKSLVFDRLGRRRLWLNVLTTNSRGRRLYRRAGFRYEGTWKDSFINDDGFEDLELMTALSSDSDERDVFEHDGHSFQFTRSFSSKHFRQIFEIYDREWPSEIRTHRDLEQAILGSDLAFGLIHQETDDLIGFCRVISDRGFRAWIHGLVVRQEFRNLGLGRRMMDHLLASKELASIRSIALTCDPGMIAFYRKWGFQDLQGLTCMSLDLAQDEHKIQHARQSQSR